MATFNQIPTDNRVPGMFVEVDGSGAVRGTPADAKSVILLGMRTTGAAGDAPLQRVVQGGADADALLGPRSQLAHMVKAFRRVNKNAKVTAIGLREPSTGSPTAAAGAFAITGTATAAGTVPFYVGHTRIPIPVAVGDTASVVAAALRAAITADPYLPVTPGGTAGQVDVTAAWKGPTGADIDLACARRDGDLLPAGLAVAVTAMSGGTGDGDVASAVAVFGDEIYDSIVSAFNDATSIGLLETELARRWGPMVQQPGIAILAKRGAHGALLTFGAARNSPFSCIVGAGASPSPSWIHAAVAAGLDAAEPDPGRPRNGLVMVGVEAPAKANAFDSTERNALLKSGIATTKLDASGQVVIERLITTYQKNTANLPDPTYLNVTTLRVLAYLRYSLRARIEAKYSRHKVANDGTRVAPGVKVATPSVIRGEVLSLATEWEAAGHIEDYESFKRDLVVERNADNPEQIDVILPPDLTNELVMVAAQIAFRF